MFIIALCAAIFLISCGATAFLPAIQYLGDDYPSTSKVEVFYEIKQVTKEYRIIGRMTRETIYRSEQTREKMIEIAKGKGADGIIFLNYSRQQNGENCNGVVHAEVIKYQQ